MPPTQEPTKAGNCTFYSLVIVIAWIQLEHCVNALASIEGVNLLCVLPNTSQNRVSSFVLLVTQGEIHAVQPALWFVGEDVLLHSRKPERTGYAAHPRKQIRLVDGIQRKQPCQRVPGDPTPGRRTSNLLLCRWNNLLSEESKIVICATSAGNGIFESGRTIPGHHIVIPVQIADSHQRKRRTAGSPGGLISPPALVKEGIEINHWGIGRIAGENRYSFPACCKVCMHSPAFRPGKLFHTHCTRRTQPLQDNLMMQK